MAQNQKNADPNFLAFLVTVMVLTILVVVLLAGGYAHFRTRFDLPGGRGTLEGEIHGAPTLPPPGDVTGSTNRRSNTAPR